MRRLFSFCVVLLVICGTFLTPPSRVSAYKYKDCKADENNLPRIPISVDKTTVDRTGSLNVTLHFEEMSNEDYNKYKNTVLTVNVFGPDDEPVYNTDQNTQSDFVTRKKIATSISLSSALIQNPVTGDLRVGIFNTCHGGLETSATGQSLSQITITVNNDKNKRIGYGEECNPNLQNVSDNPQYRCQDGVSCEKSSVPGDTKYYCGGKEYIRPSPTPTPTPPPPPCLSDNLKNGCTEITSAFGRINTDPGGFIQKLFAILLSLSGGIALLLIIRSGYQLMTSRGNAEQVKEAQDRITSAIVGLLFIIFSLVILEIIGVDLLSLPGFSKV